MFGYMTAQEALKNGFTHHGKYYGIPVWLAPDDPDFPVATKWEPFEHLMILAHHLEGIIQATCFPDDEPSFCFLVGDPIKKA